MLLVGDGNIGGMHEGQKIKELLALAGKTQSDLARACSVTPTAVQRYTGAETLGAKAWETVSQGLAQIGIDPRLIRPLAFAMQREKRGEDLRPLLNMFNHKQLLALKQILDAPSEAQHTLKVVIEDRIERGERH